MKDLTKNDIIEIYNLTDRYKNKSCDILKNKYIGMLFEKPSTRTKISFEIGIQQLGASPIILNRNELQLSRGEIIKDTASVLERYLDGLILRVYQHNIIEEFTKYFNKPVINALSDKEHPCQVLSDIYTILKLKNVSLKNIQNVKFVFVGDANNVCYSLIYVAEMLNMNAIFIIPKKVQPKNLKLKNVVITDDISYVKNADIIYTDVWVSMGQEKETKLRLNLFKKYQVNKKLVSLAKKDCMIMHCLPAKRGYEITDEVIDGKNSVVLEQAENRLHVQKGLMLYLFIKK
ncbi:MAG: ornithine carbamoyltransferase [Endomicrobiia bacterium]